MKLLTDRQIDVMRVLWTRGPSTVREAREQIDEDLAYTSVLTVFQTLEKHGHVRHEREGKAYRYHPVTMLTDAARQYAEWLEEKSPKLATATSNVIAGREKGLLEEPKRESIAAMG